MIADELLDCPVCCEKPVLQGTGLGHTPIFRCNEACFMTGNKLDSYNDAIDLAFNESALKEWNTKVGLFYTRFGIPEEY